MKKVFFLLVVFQIGLLYAEDLHTIKLNDKYGFINKELDIVLPVSYTYAENFGKDGLAIVSFENENGRTVIDRNGDTIDPLISNKNNMIRVFDNLFYVNWDGYLFDVRNKKKFGHGNVKVPYGEYLPNYDYSNFFSGQFIDKDCNFYKIKDDILKGYPIVDGFAFAITNDWEQIIMDKDGNTILENVFDSGNNPSEGLLSVITNKESGYINSKGEFVFYCDFESNWHNFSPPGINYPFQEGIAAVQVKNGIFKIFNKKGKVLMDETEFLEIKPCYEGLLLYKNKEKKFGYLNKKGKEAFSKKFDDAESFYNGFANVVYEGKDAILDKKGNIYLSEDLVAGNKKVYINVKK